MVLSKTRRIKICKSRAAFRNFLKDLVIVASLLKDPEALSWLHKAVVRTMSFRRLEREMTSSARALGRKEYRLNGAGLKLHLLYNGDDGFTAYLGGDQVDCHPDVYLVGTVLLLRHGLLPKDWRDRAPAPSFEGAQKCQNVLNFLSK